MNKEKAAAKVNSTWVYKKDGLIDRWSFKSPGDCENYALLVLKNIFGSEQGAKDALRLKKARIWYAKTDKGNGHAVLEYQGMYICNRTQKWVGTPEELAPCTLKWRYPWSIMKIRMVVG